MFENYPDVVSVDEAKEMLKIGKCAVYELLRNNRIKYIRLNRKYIIPKKAIIEFLDSAK